MDNVGKDALMGVKEEGSAGGCSVGTEYRRALMDVAEIVSSARQASVMHSDERTKFIDGKLCAYDIVLERLIGLMKLPATSIPSAP